MKKAHLLRCCSKPLAQRTSLCTSLAASSRASHLGLFDQPAVFESSSASCSRSWAWRLLAVFSADGNQNDSPYKSDGAQQWRERDRLLFLLRSVNRSNVDHILFCRV